MNFPAEYLCCVNWDIAKTPLSQSYTLHMTCYKLTLLTLMPDGLGSELDSVVMLRVRPDWVMIIEQMGACFPNDISIEIILYNGQIKQAS